jgi:hypothetical protein
LLLLLLLLDVGAGGRAGLSGQFRIMRVRLLRDPSA